MFTTNYRSIVSVVFVFVVFLLMGCKGSKDPSSASKNGKEFLKCADVGGDSKLEKISLPPLTLVRDGQDLKIPLGISKAISFLPSIQHNC